jgi:DNA-binding NarL/FixJ family response regulator
VPELGSEGIVVPEQGSEGIPTPPVGSPSPDFPSTPAHAHRFDIPEAANGAHFAAHPTTRETPSRNVKISLAVVDEHSFTRESITRSLQELCHLLDITSFVTCDECLASVKRFDLILFHAHESVANQNERLASLKRVLPITPVIVLCDVDSFDSICAAFDSGVRGYIPTISTTPELAIEIMYLVKHGGTFVPPSSLSPRRIRPQGTAHTVTTQQFTPRQMAVLARLKLGETNKIIAHELQMSESSVKTHIHNIMNKLNARNRTEVACRAHELPTGGALLVE